jgi:hypothetical protein
VPLPQVVHCSSLAVVHVAPALQLVMGVQAAQTRSVPLVHAVVSWVPVPQAAAQAMHALLPFR